MDNFDFYDLLEQDQHDPEVQYGLGICYLYGNGTEKDPDEARAWLQRAADQGHELALMLINDSDDAASGHLNEDTLPEWCMRAEEGDADAQFAVAQYLVAGDRNDAHSDAQRYLRAAAEQGHGEACMILGKQYMEACNYSSAVLYLERAYECGFVDAAELLSICYFNGIGVERDAEKAEQLLQSTANWGDAESKLRIAWRYAIGKDISPSQTKAMAWVARAQQVGMENARERFNAMLEAHRQSEAAEMERQRQEEERLRQEALEKQRLEALEKQRLEALEKQRREEERLRLEALEKQRQEEETQHANELRRAQAKKRRLSATVIIAMILFLLAVAIGGFVMKKLEAEIQEKERLHQEQMQAEAAREEERLLQEQMQAEAAKEKERRRIAFVNFDYDKPIVEILRDGSVGVGEYNTDDLGIFVGANDCTRLELGELEYSGTPTAMTAEVVFSCPKPERSGIVFSLYDTSGEQIAIVGVQNGKLSVGVTGYSYEPVYADQQYFQLESNRWYTVAVVRENHEFRLYLDGVLLTSFESMDVNYDSFDRGFENLYIGSDSQLEKNFLGCIRELNVHNYARSAEQILETALRNADTPALTEQFYIDNADLPVGENGVIFDLPEGAVRWGSHYYFVVEADMSWSSAQAYCDSLGAHLATISSEEENNMLYQLMLDSGYQNAFFGLSDTETEGQWQWVTGERVTYTNWSPGEPNDNRGEDYAMFWEGCASKTWNDARYNDYEGGPAVFLCELE